MKKLKLLLYCCIALPAFFYFNTPIHAEGNFPKRIISLGPSITEALYLLGANDRIVGVTSFCLRPPQAQEKEKIGSVININIEKVASLTPDLVLATSLTEPKAIKKLKNLGINVQSFPQPENFTKLCEQFLKLGKLVGKGNEANDIISIAKEKVNSIKKMVKDLPKPKVFVQIGAKPLFTVTNGSFADDFIEFSGGINIAKNAKTGRYSREEVLRRNPDVILIVTMGLAGEKEKEIWQKYKTLNAVRNNKIYIIDSYKLCSPTPLSFTKTLEEIAQILHPQKLRE